MVTKRQWLLGIISLFLLGSIIIITLILKANEKKEQVEKPVQIDGFSLIIDETLKKIKFQEEVEKNLLAELKSGTYSFSEPLIVVDPYDQSPLTALLLFTSVEPLNISIHIEGKERLSDINFTFNNYNTEHIIPVYGLYPDKSNNVTLISKNKKGKINKVVLKVKTQPLPKELSDIIILTDAPKKDFYQDGLNFTHNINNNKTAFDLNGDYRWFLKDDYSIPVNYNFNGRFMVAKGEIHKGDVLFYEINPMGRIFKIMYSPFGLHHDIEVFKDDHLLVTGSEGETIEDFIYEIDTKTGKIENTLDLKTLLQRSRKGLEALENSDWFHNNAISWVNGEDKILISGRHQSTVVKMSWPDGKIDWILSDHDNWLPMFEKYLLTPIGSFFEWQFNQHTPEILPDYDNDPNTIDILLFDNGNQRFEKDKELQRAVRNNEIVEPEPYSRVVHFRINEKEKTIKQIWEYGKEMGKIFYSPEACSAKLLANSNIFSVFVVKIDSSYSANYIEVSPDSEIVWQAQAISKKVNGSLTEYRAERMVIYNSDSNNLQIGTPVNNLVPKEIFIKNGIN